MIWLVLFLKISPLKLWMSYILWRIWYSDAFIDLASTWSENDELQYLKM